MKHTTQVVISLHRPPSRSPSHSHTHPIPFPHPYEHAWKPAHEPAAKPFPSYAGATPPAPPLVPQPRHRRLLRLPVPSSFPYVPLVPAVPRRVHSPTPRPVASRSPLTSPPTKLFASYIDAGVPPPAPR
ncbi:hypothetical protein B0H11DRAFT_2259281 [Mycena galericulata]|nr:hypothetical protein B0H11DRAFT_2259281 [Mycena galericulata]